MFQIGLLLLACTSEQPQLLEGSIGDRLLVTKGVQQNIPLNWEEGIADGFIECIGLLPGR